LVTITDVAKLAGVSPVTVSRVVNDSDYVSKATRERVEHAIKELGYVPHFMARGLRLNRTFTLALVLPDITNVFWTTVARGAEDAAMKNNFSILFYNVDEDIKKQDRVVDIVLSQQVDGVMIAPHDSDIKQLAKLQHNRVPTVILDRKLDDSQLEHKFDFIRGDSISGAYQLTRHLIRLGHKRIAMVSGNLHASTAQDRVLGYRMALQDQAIPFDEDLIVYGEFKASAGAAMTHQLLDQGLAFSSIFAANNMIGMGVVRELLRRNIRIPEDMSIVFYDDYATDSDYFPFFTVITQQAYEIGYAAAEMLFSRMVNPDMSSRTQILPSTLIVRYSCGAQIKDGKSPLSLPVQATSAFHQTTSRVKPIEDFLDDTGGLPAKGSNQ
jgi:LacI family transcriptional regulator